MDDFMCGVLKWFGYWNGLFKLFNCCDVIGMKVLLDNVFCLVWWGCLLGSLFLFVVYIVWKMGCVWGVIICCYCDCIINVFVIVYWFFKVKNVGLWLFLNI